MDQVMPHTNVYDLASRLAPTRVQATEYKSKELQMLTRLLRDLQSSLELSDILNTFSNELNQLVPVDGIQFEHNETDAQFETSTRGRHRVSYELKIDEDYLGTIAFTRDKRFAEADLQSIENLLSCIPYPLRNALRYRSAIRAATTDALTGSGNRIGLDAALHREIDIAKRDEIPLSVVMIDFDHFKRINDDYGHPCGDMVLKRAVKEIQQTIRKTDLLFRYGGEEFLLMLHKTGPEQAVFLAEKIRQKIETLQLEYDGQEFTATTSLGVASFDTDDTSSSLIARADRALYVAKNEGRNRVCAE